MSTRTSAIPDSNDLASHFNQIRIGADDLDSLITPQTKYDVWHRLVLQQGKAPFAPWIEPPRHIVRASPLTRDESGKIIRLSSFTTVLLKHNQTAVGLHRYRPARVRVIFRLTGPLATLDQRHLVYVDLFDPFSDAPDNATGMYTTAPTYGVDGSRESEVLPASELASVCHLFPQLSQGDAEPRQVNTPTDKLTFLLDHNCSPYTYALFKHWDKNKNSCEA